MSANNFFVTFKWMVDYKLSTSERDLYAVIYGFSQGDSSFMGSQSYLAEMVGVSRRTVIRCLKSLEEKGLIDKEIYYNGKTPYFSYCACIPCDKMSQGCDTMSQGGVTKCHRGCDTVSHNNIEDNIVDNISSLSPGAHAQNKNKADNNTYGEYKNVKLSAEDYEKWTAECPEADKYIESLSEYMAIKKTSYINHLAVLRNWYRRDKEKQAAAPKPKQKKGFPAGAPSYDIDNIEKQVMNAVPEYKKKEKDDDSDPLEEMYPQDPIFYEF